MKAEMRPMSEATIERIAERTMDRLDRELTEGVLTQEEYDEEVKVLEEWVRYESRLSR